MAVVSVDGVPTAGLSLRIWSLVPVLAAQDAAGTWLSEVTLTSGSGGLVTLAGHVAYSGTEFRDIQLAATPADGPSITVTTDLSITSRGRLYWLYFFGGGGEGVLPDREFGWIPVQPFNETHEVTVNHGSSTDPNINAVVLNHDGTPATSPWGGPVGTYRWIRPSEYMVSAPRHLTTGGTGWMEFDDDDPPRNVWSDGDVQVFIANGGEISSGIFRATTADGLVSRDLEIWMADHPSFEMAWVPTSVTVIHGQPLNGTLRSVSPGLPVGNVRLNFTFDYDGSPTNVAGVKDAGAGSATASRVGFPFDFAHWIHPTYGPTTDGSGNFDISTLPLIGWNTTTEIKTLRMTVGDNFGHTATIYLDIWPNIF